MCWICTRVNNGSISLYDAELLIADVPDRQHAEEVRAELKRLRDGGAPRDRPTEDDEQPEDRSGNEEMPKTPRGYIELRNAGEDALATELSKEIDNYLTRAREAAGLGEPTSTPPPSKLEIKFDGSLGPPPPTSMIELIPQIKMNGKAIGYVVNMNIYGVHHRSSPNFYFHDDALDAHSVRLEADFKIKEMMACLSDLTDDMLADEPFTGIPVILSQPLEFIGHMAEIDDKDD